MSKESTIKLFELKHIRSQWSELSENIGQLKLRFVMSSENFKSYG